MSDVTMTRTTIFEDSTKNYQWSKDMLTAIKTAQRLGVTSFEISVNPDKYEAPIYAPQGRDDWHDPVKIGTEMRNEDKIKVYALSVE